MSATQVSCGFAVGAAAIALWLVHRYPHRGPATLKRGFAFLACAWVLLLLVAPATAAAARLVGAPAALLTVDLPLLVFAFWTTAHLLRLYVSTIERHEI